MALGAVKLLDCAKKKHNRTLRRREIMRAFDKSRMAHQIVNLTDSEICVYEESTGIIEHFEPANDVRLDHVLMTCSAEHVYFVVDSMEEAEWLQDFGRSLRDIAVVWKSSKGRGGYLISDLVWAGDPKVKVSYRYRKVMVA